MPGDLPMCSCCGHPPPTLGPQGLLLNTQWASALLQVLGHLGKYAQQMLLWYMLREPWDQATSPGAEAPAGVTVDSEGFGGNSRERGAVSPFLRTQSDSRPGGRSGEGSSRSAQRRDTLPSSGHVSKTLCPTQILRSLSVFLGHILPGCLGREKGFRSAWSCAWPGFERRRRQKGAPRGVDRLPFEEASVRFQLRPPVPKRTSQGSCG